MGVETAAAANSSSSKSSTNSSKSNTNSSKSNTNSNRGGTTQNGTGKDLPATWDSYADLQAPFACFAPRATTWSFAEQSSPKDASAGHPSPARAVAPPEKQTGTAPAFATTAQQTDRNSLSPNKFPSGSDFFLKGKRNTVLAHPSPDDEDSAGQAKKLKLPPSASPASSSKRQPPSSTTSLRSAALERFNSEPVLQSPAAPSSAVSNFLIVHPPSSRGSSACADNGETDEPQSTTPLTPANPSPQAQPSNTQSLGFSAFAASTGFGGSSSQSTVDWSQGRTSSVFDQQQPPSSKSSYPSQPDSQPNPLCGGAGGHTGERKTHLALSAELGHEDKHEVVTGEENEELVKSIRCKMFTLGEDQSWRERGTGGLRLLRTKEQPYRYRLIMRADAVLRVLLNVPIFKGFSYRPTQDKFLTFASTVGLDPPNGPGLGTIEAAEKEGGPSKAQFQQYLCRFGKPEARQEIIDSIEECFKDLGRTSDPEADPENPPDHSADPSELV